MLVIIQHVGGVASFLGRKKNPQHRAFGKLLVNIGRAVAAVGWLLTGKVQNAIFVAVVSVVLLGLSMALGKSDEGKKQPEGESSRSKSPRAKRE